MATESTNARLRARETTNGDTGTARGDSPEATGLKQGALGTGGISFLVISAAAPLTVIAGSVPLAIMIAGPVAPTAYLIIGVALAIFALAFLAMVRHSTRPGGFYTYITESLGKRIGLGAGVLAVVSYNVMQIGIYGLVAVGAGQMLQSLFGLEVHWGVVVFVGIALVWLFGFLGIDIGAKVLGVVLVIEVAMLLVLGVMILVSGGGASGITVRMFDPALLLTPEFAAVIALAFAAFIGFESTVLYRAEARDPVRTVPRATYVSLAFTTVFYVAIVWVLIQAYGDDLVQGVIADGGPDVFFFDTAGMTLGNWGLIVFQLLIVTSGFAALLAFHNSINRYFYVLGRDGVFPRALARTRRGNGSPWVAGLTQTIIATIVVGAFVVADADPYTQLLIWLNTPGVFGVLALQILAAIAVVMYFRRNPAKEHGRYVVPAAIASAVIMLGFGVLVAVNVNALTGASMVTDALILAVTPVAFIAGLILAFWLRSRRPEAYARIGEEE